MLARAVHPQLGVPLLVGGPVAAQLGQVGEGAEQVHLVGERPRRPRRRSSLADGEVVRQRGVLVLAAGRRTRARRRSGRRGPGRRAPRPAARPPARGGRGWGRSSVDRGSSSVAVAERLEPDQGGAGLDLAAGDHQQLLDPGRRTARRAPSPSSSTRAPGPGRRPRPRRRRVHGSRDDQGRRGRAQHAALVAADPVRDAVDLDQRAGAVGRGDDVVATPAEDQPAGGTRRSGPSRPRRSARCRRRRPSPGSATGRC